MRKYPIPIAALDDRLGWIGNSGSGKTHDAGTAIEKVVYAKSRACIVDPLGVWWGLRLAADGKSAGFKVAIFGGPHGDIAITETSGKLIGETVASTKESCIIDLSEFESDASQRRFMLAFLVALYNSLNGDLLHLVLDEADMWAPQRILDKEGEATKLHHNVQKIVRRGRVKGFISWLITQRPAEISKSILSMMEGMILHQALSPQDIGACMDWVRPRADKATAELIETGMPAFETGQAAVYIPRRKVLNIAQFPKKVTFDSSAAPERGKKKNRPDVKLKPLDIDALKKKLEKVEAEAKANDPSLLKSEIAKLKSEKAALERAKPAAPAKPDKEAVKADLTEKQKKAIERAATTAKVEGYAEAMTAAGQRFVALLEPIPALADALAPLKAGDAALKPLKLAMNQHAQWLTDQAQRKKPAIQPVTRDDVKKAIEQSGSPAGTGTRPAPTRAPASPAARASSPAASGDGTISKAQLTLLRALAWWRNMGHDEPRRPQLAAIAGWKPTGSNLRDRISELKRAGLIEPRGDTVRLTAEGIAAAPEPDTGATMVDGVRSVLSAAQLKLFDALHEHGNAAVERATLAERLGWEPGGSNLRDRLSELRRLDLVSTKGSQVQLADWLFPF